jgi:deazaflavin-dependent oxidoreductase (nitroreductase family)
VPSDGFLKAMNALHRGLLTLTRGRIGRDLGGMPVVELTTTGRKSGLPRTVMLTSPVQLGDAYVVVASRGGDDEHPAWFHNLVANPDVEVTIGAGSKRPMTARVASPDERAQLWPQVTAKYRGYAGYQRKTDREIPLVVLEPPGARDG